MENTFDLKIGKKEDECNKKGNKSIFVSFLKKNKIISFIVVAFLILSLINFCLVYSFVVELTNIM